MSVDHAELMCAVDSLNYDFEARKGILNIAHMHAVDAGGCFRLFEGIDKNVQVIEIVAGGKPDSAYVKANGEWELRTPR